MNRFDHSVAEGSALGPEALEGLKEWRTPGANHQKRAEENYGVNAQTAACLYPIDVRVKVEPKGELVQCERGAHAIGDGHDAAEKDGHGRVRAAKVEQPSVAHE